MFWGLVQGPLLDRFDLGLLSRDRSSFVTGVNRDTLWERLRPGRGPVETHWDALLEEAETDPDDPARVFLNYRLGGVGALMPNRAIEMWFDNYERDRVLYARNRLENRCDGTLSGAIRRKVLSFS